MSKLVTVEIAECENGRINLQAVSGRNLGTLPGTVEISREEYDSLPNDPYNDIERARAALALCGWKVGA